MNLEETLKNHKEYLLSDAKKGKRANLRGANLGGANLNGIDFRGADFTGANLNNAKLRGTYLTGANLSNAKLKGADLRGAKLRGADLRGANLNGADLRRTLNISTALFDRRHYQLIAWKHKDEFWFNAGCKSLLYEDALEYWGSPNYPNKIRGEAYCKAINFLTETWPWDMEK